MVEDIRKCLRTALGWVGNLSYLKRGDNDSNSIHLDCFCSVSWSTWVGLDKDVGDDAGARLPNIVLILADELGIGDVGAYGGEVIETPHINKLAESGVRFTAGYVTQPVCSPSRAGLITGRYQR